MRRFLLIAIPLLAGALVGYGLAAWEVGKPEIPVLPPPGEPTPTYAKMPGNSTLLDTTDISRAVERITERSPAAAPINPKGKSKVQVEETAFDFGTLPPDEKSQHAFTFKNVGDAPLELKKGKSSCFCTVAEIGQDTLAPGESTAVTLQFHGQHNGPFSQHVSVETSDPGQPSIELSISGTIRPWVAADPESFSLGRISDKEQRTVELRLYAYKDQPLALTKVEFFGMDAADNFAATNRPLTAEELSGTDAKPPETPTHIGDPDFTANHENEKKESRAKSGLLVTITLKSGLPWGRLQTRIVLTTNYVSQPIVEIPLDAIVEGDVSVVGKNWDAERQTLSLGSVSRGGGAEVKLLLVARGERRKETTFRIASVTPDALHATVGEPQPLGEGNQPWQTPLTIAIPPGTPVMNHLGGEQGKTGEIVVESNHPDAPRITIRVRFAVER